MLVSDRPERTEPGSVLYAGDRELVVEVARRARQGWVVRFAGVVDRDGAEALRGAVLSAPALDTLEGELWVHELVGREVVDRGGQALGRVVAVQANPAHDLLVLEGGELVPTAFVVEQRAEELVVDVPEGLLDL